MKNFLSPKLNNCYKKRVFIQHLVGWLVRVWVGIYGHGYEIKMDSIHYFSSCNPRVKIASHFVFLFILISDILALTLESGKVFYFD